MTSLLEEIIAQKHAEVASLRYIVQQQPNHPIALLLNGTTLPSIDKSFKQALQQSKLAVIAEIKRRSPSKGTLAEIGDPLLAAHCYLAGGANALSILTDQQFFGGSLTDLTTIAQGIKRQPQPILRKDFIIDAIQIAEAAHAGANAVLAIVTVLKQQTKSIVAAAKQMNIEVLVEIQDETELAIAIAAEAEIIGINNRDLATFQVDPERALNLVTHIPKNLVKIAESGIISPKMARTYHQAGFDAVLIGEALIKATKPESFIQACKHVPTSY